MSAICLWLTFKGVPFAEIGRAIKNIKLKYFLTAYCFALFGTFLRAIQWYFVLYRTRRVPLNRLYSYMMIGFFVNYILPFRLGEIARSHMASRKEGIKFTTSLATVFLTRIFDLLSLFAILIYVVFFSGLFSYFQMPDGLLTVIKTAAYTLISIFFIIFVLFLISFYCQRKFYVRFKAMEQEQKPVRWRKFIFKLIKYGFRLTGDFLDGLKMFKNYRDPVATIIVSFAIWFNAGLVTLFLFYSFDVRLPLSAGLFVLTIIFIGIAVPGVPGYAGQFHAACRYALVPFAVSSAVAASIAICLHALHMSYSIVIGGICLILEKIKLSEIRRLGPGSVTNRGEDTGSSLNTTYERMREKV